MSSGPPNIADGHAARGDPDRGDLAADPANTARESQATGAGRPSQAEPVATAGPPGRKWHRFASGTRRRLGLVEYTLVALIALGVAITTAMAIANP